MLVLAIRTVILYLLVIVTMRIMGKHQIGQLQPFELVIAIMISEIAAVPMQDPDTPLLNGVIPVLILLFLQITFSLLSLKSDTARRMICGKPTIIVKNGYIQEKELRKLRYSINDLLEQARLKGYSCLSDIEFAIVETSGQLSIIPKSQKRPVIPEDLGLNTSYEGVPITLIVDGVLKKDNLKSINLSENWLLTELKKFNISHWKEVFFASINSNGELFLQLKGGRLL